MDGSALMHFEIGNEIALAYGLLLARTAAVVVALPPMLGVAIPVRVRAMLSAILAGSLMPAAAVAMPAAPGIIPIAILLAREVCVGAVLAFAVAIVSGAVIMVGDLAGAGMELNSGSLLRGSIAMPNHVADAMGTLAGLLFFVGGFHRQLLIALARSISIVPLGRIEIPAVGSILGLSERLFILALQIGFPIVVPLFVLAAAQGVIARVAPQVNILVAAPAAIALAGLTFLALDSTGLARSIDRAWAESLSVAMGWLDG
jgi:flagellar biosynthetic protein FliR